MIPLVGVLVANPVVRKVAPYALAGVALLFTLRLWTNGIKERAAAEARVRQVEQQLDVERKGWAEKEKALAVQQEALDKEWGTLNDQRALLGQSRLSIKGELAQGIGGLKAELDRRQGEIARVPGSELDGRIRQQLGALR